MIAKLRSRFHIRGIGEIDAGRVLHALRAELAVRPWNQRPVAEWDGAQACIAIEVGLEVDQAAPADLPELIQIRELSRMLAGCETPPLGLSVHLDDSWIERSAA